MFHRPLTPQCLASTKASRSFSLTKNCTSAQPCLQAWWSGSVLTRIPSPTYGNLPHKIPENQSFPRPATGLFRRSGHKPLSYSALTQSYCDSQLAISLLPPGPRPRRLPHSTSHKSQPEHGLCAAMMTSIGCTFHYLTPGRVWLAQFL
jgi:hypothetical protein